MSTTEQTFQSLPIAFIRISKTNRKRFNQQALEELAANIKANGLIQPILVRPVPQTETEAEPFEIVCGERRYRASKIAELESINVICRELSDTQAAELQLIENLQREDPHPMEEAEGYQALMLHSGYTAEMLAEKLNKSKSQIYATLKLCNLCKELRDEFFENKDFTRSLALLVARIPVPALQVKAFKEIMEGYGAEPYSYRDAAEHIQAHYNVHLKTAIFSTTDTKLVADAGACRVCHKRTGNDPDLADLDKNICTDPECYEAKSIAHYARIIEKAESGGLTVLREKDAELAIRSAINSPAIDVMDSTCLHFFARLKNTADRNKTVGAAIGSDKLPEPRAIAVINNIPTKLYNKLHIQIILEELGFAETEAQLQARIARATEGPSDDDDDNDDDDESDTGTDTAALDRSAKEAEANRKAENEEIKRMRIYRAIRARGQLSLESLRHFIIEINSTFDLNIPQQFHQELYGQEMVDDDTKISYINQASSEQLQLLLIDYVIGYGIMKPRSYFWSNEYLDRKDAPFKLIEEVATAEGIDIASVEQEEALPVQVESSETAPIAPAPKKRGRPAKVAASEQTHAAKPPAPIEKWPFPTPKKESDES